LAPAPNHELINGGSPSEFTSPPQLFAAAAAAILEAISSQIARVAG
jgi:hypothetical protein